MFKNDLQYCYQLCDFRFLLWCKWYLRSSGILRSVSGHTGCNLFVWKYNSVLYEIPEEHRSHLLSAVYSTMNLVYHFNTLCEILVFVLYILHFCYLFHIVLSLKLNFLCIICIVCVCVYLCINKISQTVYMPQHWRISFFQTTLNNSSIRQVFAYLGFTVGLIETCLNLPTGFHGSN